MLVNIALNAATVCTARTCTKRLNETQWPETIPTAPISRHIAPRRDLRHIGLRLRHSGFCPRRDVSMSRDRDVLTKTTSLP